MNEQFNWYKNQLVAAAEERSTKDTWKRDLEKTCGQDTMEEDGGGSTR